MRRSFGGPVRNGEEEVRGMRRVVVSEFVSLDGVMQAPGGPDEDTSGGFKHGGWSFKFRDDQVPKYKLDELSASDALLLGRKTYEIFAAYWPNANDDVGFANKLNSMAKHVVSTTLKKVDWNNSKLIKTNVAEEVRMLKQQPGKDVLVYGSGKLVNTLLKLDLVDEVRLMVYPVVLRSGRRLFDDHAETLKPLKLAESKTFPSGIVLLSYHPAK
jgi:dihydrofolate reductase